LDYWRKRIRNILVLPDVSRLVEKEALTLLKRLDRLHFPPRDTTGRN